MDAKVIYDVDGQSIFENGNKFYRFTVPRKLVIIGAGGAGFELGTFCFIHAGESSYQIYVWAVANALKDQFHLTVIDSSAILRANLTSHFLASKEEYIKLYTADLQKVDPHLTLSSACVTDCCLS